MPPVWEPNEADAGVYRDVERHSEGMMSFTFRPPSSEDIEALKDTETYRALLRENGEAALGRDPAREKVGPQA